MLNEWSWLSANAEKSEKGLASSGGKFGDRTRRGQPNILHGAGEYGKISCQVSGSCIDVEKATGTCQISIKNFREESNGFYRRS